MLRIRKWVVHHNGRLQSRHLFHVAAVLECRRANRLVRHNQPIYRVEKLA
jgi:hypothetical protein